MKSGKDHIVVIGAGAAGLMAASILAKQGYVITILEARDRIGGRIHTLTDPDFEIPIELGAEFIHGNLEVTRTLLKKANVKSFEMEGEMWEESDGKLNREDEYIDDWKNFHKQLKKLKDDVTVSEFLDRNFPGDRHHELRSSVRGFIEGYDAADPDKASALAIKDEWLGVNDSRQRRIEGGYIRLIECLASECRTNGATVYLSTRVKEIHWKHSSIKIIADDGRSFGGNKVIITVPLGVLQLDPNHDDAISFVPPLAEKLSAARQMGYGAVLKILLQFDEAFWKNNSSVHGEKKRMGEMGFLFSNKTIPTWWTQLPQEAPILTGWLAGPKVDQQKEKSDEELLTVSLGSLASIFRMSEVSLRKKLTAWRIANWAEDPLALGAYSYTTVGVDKARSILNEDVEGKLFFAGEASYEGPHIGTVEAALVSGIDAAKRVKKISKG